MYFLSESISRNFQNWSEILGLDTTYSLLALDYPVLNAIVIDGNGATKLASMAVLVHEDEEIYSWVMKKMKEYRREAYKNIQDIMGDKVIVARKCITEELKKPMVLCHFHVVQIWLRQFTKEKYGITKNQKDDLINI